MTVDLSSIFFNMADSASSQASRLNPEDPANHNELSDILARYLMDSIEAMGSFLPSQQANNVSTQNVVRSPETVRSFKLLALDMVRSEGFIATWKASQVAENLKRT